MTSDFINVLAQAANAYQEGTKLPEGEIVVNALLAAETHTKNEKINYNFSDLNGKWRLCFATGTKKVRKKGGIILKAGRYMPKFLNIYLAFSENLEKSHRGEISNQVQLGSILLKLTGLTKFLGKKNILAFDFLQMQLSFLNKIIFNKPISSGKNSENLSESFYEKPIAKLPFFVFFLITENMIAARGKGGGLALWFKEN